MGEAIQPPKLERSNREVIRDSIAGMSREQNSSVGFELLSEDGRLDEQAFTVAKGGTVKKEELKRHQAVVRKLELEWSGLAKPEVRSFYAEQFRVKLDDLSQSEADAALLKVWRTRHEERSTGGSAEMAITLTLYRQLAPRYLVVRAARYDDAMHGVDNLIIDRETGEVVAAFDDVADEPGGSREQKKRKRLQAGKRAGGTEVTYGVTFEQGELVRRSFKHVPLFALQIAAGDISKVLLEMAGGVAEPGAAEVELYDRLVASLEQQVDELLALHPEAEIAERLQRFSHLLPSFRREEAKPTYAAS